MNIELFNSIKNNLEKEGFPVCDKSIMKIYNKIIKIENYDNGSTGFKTFANFSLLIFFIALFIDLEERELNIALFQKSP